MSELNSTKQNRSKQIIYWNLKTLNSMHSLTEMIIHSPYPKLYSAKDKDWRDLFYFNKLYLQGKQIAQSFISRSKKYVSNSQQTFDRVSLYKSQLFQLNVIKHQFWTRVYRLNPISKEDLQSRRIVRNIVWRERLIPYGSVIIIATIVNAISGIVKLKMSKRLVTFGVLACVAEIMVKVKKSDKIFYSIPTLPNPDLQAERQMILNQCLVIDGKINSYGLPTKIDQQLLSVAQKQKNEAQKIQILTALGYNVVKKSNYID